jgi:hypothetical protein
LARADSPSHSGGMDDLEDLFGRLAAIIPILRYLAASRLGPASILHRKSRQGLDAMVLVAIRAQRSFRDFVRNCGRNTRKNSSIVMVESQLVVSWGVSPANPASTQPGGPNSQLVPRGTVAARPGRYRLASAAFLRNFFATGDAADMTTNNLAVTHQFDDRRVPVVDPAETGLLEVAIDPE